jgi:hypothetical protein
MFNIEYIMLFSMIYQSFSFFLISFYNMNINYFYEIIGKYKNHHRNFQIS